MSDPLDHFAVPGVLEARKQVERQAAEMIAKEFPDDVGIELSANRIFEMLQYEPAVITAESIFVRYRALRKSAMKK